MGIWLVFVWADFGFLKSVQPGQMGINFYYTFLLHGDSVPLWSTGRGGRRYEKIFVCFQSRNLHGLDNKKHQLLG